MSDDHSRFTPTQTMAEFMASESFVRVIGGPIGSGKSVACVHELLALAVKQKPNNKNVRKTRTLIVRNTMDQLRSTVMKTFFDWVPAGIYGYYRAQEKTFYMDVNLPDGTRVNSEFMFMPLDTPDDVRKALSLELTNLWINEWREVRSEVVDGLLMRLRRYPSMREGGFTRSCAIFDTNMPDMDTWHFEQMENPPVNWSVHVQPTAILTPDEHLQIYQEEPEAPPVVGYDDTRWVANPGADNASNLSPDYYRDIIPGKSEDFIRVYMRCEYGRSLSGRPVYDKTFNADTHVAKEPFLALKSVDRPIIIGLDFGRTPAAVFIQQNVYGQLVALSELISENMGIETFLHSKLQPHITEHYLGCSFMVAPDPAGFHKQQIGEISPVDIIKQAGFKVAKPVTNDPERRIQAVERVLSRQVGGRPGFVINPGCSTLVKGFKYGYRYRIKNNGSADNRPEKNEYSHPHDASQYGVLIADGNTLYGEGMMGSGYQTPKKVSYVYA